MQTPAEQYIRAASKSCEHITLLGIIGKFETDPPTRFYSSQLTRAARLHVSSGLVTRTVISIASFEMLMEVDKLPPNRNVFERMADHPGWLIVNDIVTSSGIAIPNIEIDQKDIYRTFHGRNGYSDKSPEY